MFNEMPFISQFCQPILTYFVPVSFRINSIPIPGIMPPVFPKTTKSSGLPAWGNPEDSETKFGFQKSIAISAASCSSSSVMVASITR